MGVQGTPARLFYDFCLDEHVPSDHLLRGIDRHLDLADLRRSLKPFYSRMGRPSIDPELMMRMLMVGYCMGIRSERRLCEEVHLNLAYRWFCKLGLDGKVPDHSTFSKNRHGRFRESDALRHLFESVVQHCVAEGLVGAEGFAVDASLIAADANKQRSVPSKDWKPADLKENAVRAAREYLATLDDAAFGAASSVTPKFISRSDPAAQWTGAHKGHAFFAYAANYLIDTDHGVIVDVEAHPAGGGRSGADDDRADGDPFRHEAGLSCRRQRLRFSGEPGLARQSEGDLAVHSRDRQIEPDRRNVLARRIRLRFRTRPLHMSRRQRTAAIPSCLLDPEERRQRRWHAILPRDQIGLRRLRTQAALLPRPGGPQGAEARARGRPGRGSRSRFNT